MIWYLGFISEPRAWKGAWRSGWEQRWDGFELTAEVEWRAGQGSLCYPPFVLWLHFSIIKQNFFLQIRQIENNTNKANTNHKKWQSWHIPPTVSHLSANQWDKNNDNLTSTNTKLGKIFQVTKTIWNMFNDEPWFNCILYLKTLATAQRSEPLFPIFCLV